MPQIFVFGIVGRCIVDLCSESESAPEVDAESTHQAIGVAMFLSAVGERVFREVERLSCGVDKSRTHYVSARKVVVTHLSVEHATTIQPIERLDLRSRLHRVGRLKIVDQVALAELPIHLCRGDVSPLIGGEPGGIDRCKPCIGLLNQPEIAIRCLCAVSSLCQKQARHHQECRLQKVFARWECHF